ncbi:Sodium- and chloride-dependent GABA transporter 1 [Pseudocercospora fuligena]|uniref:Sodium- and chloride-dependent GABA transporter 1 n=1 Tax=Pseudocercospora fuligena TaxID=685502 RepID=A0A8H6VMT8_9PEZI|nr:Sodium- and chloride-dependent GABA transporter 1 [Pseudocercospora fuligena]
MKNPLASTHHRLATITANPLKWPKTLGRHMTKENQKTEDGRDQWKSRTSYLLASMGGAIGFGNLLRFPSVVFNNNGIQFFIPYFLALSILAIPVLILEVALGSSLRGGPILAYNAIDKRARGAGLGNIWVTLLVVLYYVPMLSWVLRFFRASFQSPLPWENNLQNFWENDVLRNVAASQPLAEALESNTIMSYPGTDLIGEHVGWNAFSWFIVFLCIYGGTRVTGKVVYVTMGLPIIIIFVLIVRGATLPGAIDGIKQYVGEFNGGQLVAGQIWQDSLGQVFYSTGVGFGYYTAYASYNAQNANAVQDAILICCCNSIFEIACGFAVFSIVGFLGMTYANTGRVGSFVLGFITLPEGLAQMPGAQVWSVIFFFTLFMLAVSSAFVMLDTVVSVLCDTDRGRKMPRVYIVTACTVVAFLVSMIYNTEFGPQLLDAVDMNTNNLVLPFVVFSECYGATVIYRAVDVIGQVGVPAFVVNQVGFIGGLATGLAIAHNVSVDGGVGAGFGLFFLCTLISVLIAKTPDSIAPGFWSRNAFFCRFWWLAFYSGNQLKRDLNVTVATGKNWPLPWFWAIILRYVSMPVLAIVFSFGYPAFTAQRVDPLVIFAFAVAHFALLTVVSTLIFPRWVDPLIPTERLKEGDRSYAPQVVLGAEDIRVTVGLEEGSRGESSGEDEKKNGEETMAATRVHSNTGKIRSQPNDAESALYDQK